MNAVEVIGERIKERGITQAELSRRVGMNRELLRRSLDGTRNLRGDELVNLCYELGLEISDFEKNA